MLSVAVLCSLLGALWISPLNGQQTGPSPVVFVSPESCSEGVEYYSPSRLTCLSCGANRTTAEDGLTCTCSPGFIQPIGSQDCTECASPTVSSRDGLFCLSCVDGYNSATGQCNTCPGGRSHILVDTPPDPAGSPGSRECVECPVGSWAAVGGLQCIPCGVGDCSQCTSTITHGGVCFPPTPPLPSPPTNVFHYYQEHFTAATQLCVDGNASSCQLLANLCTLQLYNRDDPACVLIQQLSEDLLQSLYYPPGSADQVLESTDIQTSLITREGAEGVSNLPLWAGSYSLNGTLLGLEELTQQILLCTEPQPRASALWRVGVVYQISCTVSAEALLRKGSNAPVFYELYLHDQTSTTDTLHSLPVLITNYRSTSGEAVNDDSDVGSWQFVRRFFLFESVTARPLYTSSTTLTVLMMSEGGRIFPPYLRVSYSNWTPTDQDLPSSHITEYAGTSQSFLIALIVLSLVCAVLGGVYSGLKVNGFVRRTGLTCCDLHSLVYAVVMFCDGTSTLLYLLLTAISLFWLIFYKVQYYLLLPLPSPTEDLTFILLLAMAALFRILHVLYQLWHQSKVDVFFIDWEKPRGLVQTTNQNADVAQTIPPNRMSPVSIWRTYFVVNEWNELQSLRRINNTLLVAMVLLFAHVIGLEHLAERDPASNVTSDPSRYSAPFSPILRFSITTIFFSLFAALLRGYMFLIYERYFEHKLRQFVDLCSVANVSVLVLSRQLYGHYIHGKSVHGHADTDMRQMNYNFKKEQEDMCGRRGLEGDDQLFEMLLTREFRTHYDKIVTPLRGDGLSHAQAGQTGVSEAGLKAHQGLTYYLSTFIEHGLKDVDYIVGVKTAMERLLGIEFFDALGKCVFYKTARHSFGDVLFHGCEWSLFQLDLLLFGIIDVVSNSYPLAAVITLLVSWLVMFVRDWAGRRNIAKKTLVDERFLL
ncbi:meckelin-like [Halichondria panicea]|uniref:meckelin-like n=1 Tax=Halichondria panicea TaxID=6063 RepID=UPI00312B8D11